MASSPSRSEDNAMRKRADGGARSTYGALVRRGRRMTTAEYLATPESVLPTELDHGRFIARDAPSIWHQDAVGNIYTALKQHLAASGEGRVWMAPVDVVLDYDNAVVVQPDVVVVTNGRLDRVTSRINAAPDLAVEVLSPFPRVGQIHQKLNWFARYGVRECWVVHLGSRRLEVLTFEQGATASHGVFDSTETVVSAVLPSFSPTVERLVFG
jgi:Uma2 family endonuclease